eukprot:GHVS01048921.1.p1 GENE.GHVS01048921.1~~GHVS01048921.1.p1  ORF type:complete len:235 (+),score=41.62 GHVS01048921.1:335-1039(+)
MAHYSLSDSKRCLLRLCFDRGVLQLGEFELKSGRISPYFFNASGLSDGQALSVVAEALADELIKVEEPFDVVFGAAYKGIPLAAAVTICLSERFNKPVPYCFNRKESKTHGEKGLLVGHQLLPGTKVMVVDDVLTAGTATREAVQLLREQFRCKVVGVMTVFDRMEVGGGTDVDEANRRISAAEMVQEELGIKVQSALTIDDLLLYISEQDEGSKQDIRKNIEIYRQKYGVFRS